MKRSNVGGVVRLREALAPGTLISLLLFLLAPLVVCLFIVGPSSKVVAQSGEAIKAELTVRADQPKGTINRNIYGNFAEHLGRDIYDGIWVGEGSSIPNTRGIRNDIIAALKNMGLPLLRWPGGCFADEYHWRDGIGPRDKRPKRINTWWGNVVETNAFGTHEFMDLCELIGADAYIAGNVASGTPQEMMDWVEYMTSDSDSTLASMRRQNGREKPWKVPYWGVGNENWGCGGNMRPEYYADVYRRFATFVKNYSGNRIQKIASGHSDANYAWTEVLMSQAARQMEGLSLHHYTLPTGNWSKKGSAIQFGEDEWHSTLVRTLRIDEYIQKHSAIMDKYDPQKRVGLMVDEWGTWYDPEPGDRLGALYQQSTMRDALVAGINLNIFHKHADRVQMANIAQTVNVLQAVILTEKEKMLLTPTYHVFEMYKVHQGATLIPVELTTPEYKLGQASVPALHASASKDKDGKLHVSIINLDPNRPAQVSMKIVGASAKRNLQVGKGGLPPLAFSESWAGVNHPSQPANLGVLSVTGRVLTAPAINTVNSFEKPDVIKPAPFTGLKVEGDLVTLSLPSKSVVVLEVK